MEKEKKIHTLTLMPEAEDAEVESVVDEEGTGVGPGAPVTVGGPWKSCLCLRLNEITSCETYIDLDAPTTA